MINTTITMLYGAEDIDTAYRKACAISDYCDCQRLIRTEDWLIDWLATSVLIGCCVDTPRFDLRRGSP